MPPEVPSWKALLWPTLQAVTRVGSASNREIEAGAAELSGATPEQQAVPHGDGARYTELAYRVAWCRTYLKGVGYLDTGGRGVWSVTDAGRQASEADMATVEARYRALRKQGVPSNDPGLPDGAQPVEGDGSSWRDELLRRLLALAPDAFERLSRRLLLEAGFVQVTVTGRSGDEGIDGTGIYRPTLVSFPVFFQCKRYKGSVGPGKVRDFRGAMAGRGDQGILITTGTFTADATAEASRAGAPLIDLIDGDGLCSLLKQFGLGVQTTTRTVEDVVLMDGFFDQI